MTFAITGWGAPKLPLNYIISVCREQKRTVDQIKFKNIFFFQIFVKRCIDILVFVITLKNAHNESDSQCWICHVF